MEKNFLYFKLANLSVQFKRRFLSPLQRIFRLFILYLTVLIFVSDERNKDVKRPAKALSHIQAKTLHACTRYFIALFPDILKTLSEHEKMEERNSIKILRLLFVVEHAHKNESKCLEKRFFRPHPSPLFGLVKMVSLHFRKSKTKAG